MALTQKRAAFFDVGGPGLRRAAGAREELILAHALVAAFEV